jgi:hypothetical protein
MKVRQLRQIIREEIQSVIKENKVVKERSDSKIEGDFNAMDFPGPSKKEAIAYLKTPEGMKAVAIFKNVVNAREFDSEDLRKAIKKARFTKMNHFRAAAAKGGLKLDNLGMDNKGNGDFSVENPNYTSQGAAITFFGDKYDSIGGAA